MFDDLGINEPRFT